MGAGHSGCKCRPGFLGNGVTCQVDPSAADNSANDERNLKDLEQMSEAKALTDRLEHALKEQIQQDAADRDSRLSEMQQRIADLRMSMKDNTMKEIVRTGRVLKR